MKLKCTNISFGTMTKNRLEAFSDGVLAIIITVMVLELKAPHGYQLSSLAAVWPEMVSYLLSFVMVGIYWNNHHHLFQAVKHISGNVMWANLHLLFWLSLLPFATEWLRDSNFVGAPAGLFGFVLLMSALAFTLMTLALVRLDGPDSPISRAMGRDLKGKVSVLCYLIGIGVYSFAPYISCALYVLVALIWFVPDKRFARAHFEVVEHGHDDGGTRAP
jgi:uncharacterized membrane protein